MGLASRNCISAMDCSPCCLELVDEVFDHTVWDILLSFPTLLYPHLHQFERSTVNSGVLSALFMGDCCGCCAEWLKVCVYRHQLGFFSVFVQILMTEITAASYCFIIRTQELAYQRSNPIATS